MADTQAERKAGSVVGLFCAPRPVNIFFDLIQFSFRLMSSAQLLTGVNSRSQVCELAASKCHQIGVNPLTPTVAIWVQL